MLEVLDPRQLVRIEAVHRGFLYQHLYVAGCLMLAGPNEVLRVTVEGDEDIQLDRVGEKIYIQVKTRENPLQPNEIDNALENFSRLRLAHAQELRSGHAHFIIVTNAALSPLLSRIYADEAWPKDVAILYPKIDEARPPFLPFPWPDVVAGVNWCVEKAQSLPLLMISPEALVWKLASQAAFAGMGGVSDHTFLVEDLSKLFEQLAIQLQRFPAVPAPYRPLENEPQLMSENRIRVISGFSGAGKTAWASQSAAILPGLGAYYDAADVPGPAIASGLVRELGAQWASKEGGDLLRILMPGASGSEALRGLDHYLATQGAPAIVVLDNSHRIPCADLRLLVESTRHIGFVLLAQPAPSILELTTILGIQPEILEGWALDEIAQEVESQNATATIPELNRLRSLTGGLPLFVKSAVQLSAMQYGGSVATMCDDVLRQAHLTQTAQELVLSRLFEAFLPETRKIVAVLSLPDVPFSRAEVEVLCSDIIEANGGIISGALRQLSNLGALRVYGDRRLQIHDALRLVGQQHFAAMGEEARLDVWRAIHNIVLESFIEHREHSRFPLYIKALIELADVEPLVDLGSEEWFHELGVATTILAALEQAANDESLNPQSRFYALDGIVLAKMKASDTTNVGRYLVEMQRLVDDHALGNRSKLTVQLKKMVYDASMGREGAALEALQFIDGNLAMEPSHARIAIYMAAFTLHELKHHDLVKTILEGLIEQYFDALGIQPLDLIGASGAKIAQLLPSRPEAQDDTKHLADCLDFWAKTLDKLGANPGLSRVHALKLYSVANALESVIRVGQDLADEFIGRGDAIGARQVMEQHMLPIVKGHGLLHRAFDVRSQYAVILAYCGDHEAAQAEISRLEFYAPGLDAPQRQTFENQKLLVTQLQMSSLSTQTAALAQVRAQFGKVGRNELCPCGSGKKFKRCHGV